VSHAIEEEHLCRCALLLVAAGLPCDTFSLREITLANAHHRRSSTSASRKNLPKTRATAPAAVVETRYAPFSGQTLLRESVLTCSWACCRDKSMVSLRHPSMYTVANVTARSLGVHAAKAHASVDRSQLVTSLSAANHASAPSFLASRADSKNFSSSENSQNNFLLGAAIVDL
jgi:hypothetical protein